VVRLDVLSVRPNIGFVARHIGLAIHAIVPLSLVVTNVALIGANIGPILCDVFAVCLISWRSDRMSL